MTKHLRSAQSPERTSETPEPIRVVVADDHNLMRRNVRLLLGDEDGFEVIHETADLARAERHVRAHHPQVLVLDLSLPNGSTMTTIETLRRDLPCTEIVLLTMEANPEFAKRALAAGAIGYVLKDHAKTDLADAVRNAVRAEQYVSSQISAGIRAVRTVETTAGLTDREIEVLRLTALGYTTNETAHQLHISPRTVDSHRACLHRKLAARTRAELVRYALRHGLMGDV